MSLINHFKPELQIAELVDIKRLIKLVKSTVTRVDRVNKDKQVNTTIGSRKVDRVDSIERIEKEKKRSITINKTRNKKTQIAKTDK